MKALDVMVRNVVTVKPDDQVAEAIKLLAEHDVSALPVVDDGNNVVGIISEADLLHRQEIGTEKYRPWWLESCLDAGQKKWPEPDSEISQKKQAFDKRYGEPLTPAEETHVPIFLASLSPDPPPIPSGDFLSLTPDF